MDKKQLLEKDENYLALKQRVVNLEEEIKKYKELEEKGSADIISSYMLYFIEKYTLPHNRRALELCEKSILENDISFMREVLVEIANIPGVIPEDEEIEGHPKDKILDSFQAGYIAGLKLGMINKKKEE